jgi:hypothetical protein
MTRAMDPEVVSHTEAVQSRESVTRTRWEAKRCSEGMGLGGERWLGIVRDIGIGYSRSACAWEGVCIPEVHGDGGVCEGKLDARDGVVSGGARGIVHRLWSRHGSGGGCGGGEVVRRCCYARGGGGGSVRGAVSVVCVELEGAGEGREGPRGGRGGCGVLEDGGCGCAAAG